MPTKIGIDQHNILHQTYPGDCCLCKAEQRIKTLEDKLTQQHIDKAEGIEKLALPMTGQMNLNILALKINEIIDHLPKEVPDKAVVSKFNCELDMNHCVSGDAPCENQHVIEGICEHYKPKYEEDI